MSDTFSPRTDQVLRIRFDDTARQFVLEQSHLVPLNGAFWAQDLNDRPDPEATQWEERARFDSLMGVVIGAYSVMYNENVTLSSIDLGITLPNGPVVQEVTAELVRARF